MARLAASCHHAGGRSGDIETLRRGGDFLSRDQRDAASASKNSCTKQHNKHDTWNSQQARTLDTSEPPLVFATLFRSLPASHLCVSLIRQSANRPVVHLLFHESSEHLSRKETRAFVIWYTMVMPRSHAMCLGHSSADEKDGTPTRFWESGRGRSGCKTE